MHAFPATRSTANQICENAYGSMWPIVSFDDFCMRFGGAIGNQHDSLITLTALARLIILCERKKEIGFFCFIRLNERIKQKYTNRTRCRISKAYSKPDVKLATFSHLIALTASFISLILSVYARTCEH